VRILAIQNDETDPPHLAAQWLEEQGHEVVILRAFSGEEVPTTVPTGIDALMPMGGHMGALDDHIAEWLPHERAMIADAAARDLPIFAICLGAQLVAAALGGEVVRSETPEIGVYEITPLGVADPVFDSSETVIATQWHEDKVSRLPEGAVTLASSPLCENQIYRFGSKSYAVQFHPEVDAQMVQSWEDHADNAYQTSGKSNIVLEFNASEERLYRIWKPTIQRWGSLIQQ
jgi:GMP synthase-like glutamine amidotransferase